MTYALHVSGDCGPGCQPCANECAGCLQWLHQCTCPTLPLDEDQEDQ